MDAIQSQFLRLECHAEEGYFDVYPARGVFPRINQARLAITYRQNGHIKKALNDGWDPQDSFQRDGADRYHGNLKQIEYTCRINRDGLQCHLAFALPEACPFLLCRVELANLGESPIEIERITMLSFAGGERSSNQDVVGGIELSEPGQESQLSFFSNGWGSWSPTAAYTARQGALRTRFKAIQTPLCNNPGTPQPGEAGHFSSDFFGAVGDHRSRNALLVGFLSQIQHFGSLETWIADRVKLSLWANGDRARLDPGSSMQTDWAVIMPFNLDRPDPLAPYLEAVARQNQVAIKVKPPVGWCSWYQYYQKITAATIGQNLDKLLELRDFLPLDLLQIDDGFQSQVGDWFSFRPGFPDGVARLAREIGAKGLAPGLWLAPFIVHPAAKLMRDAPELILRNRLGLPVNAGFVWNVFTHALDLSHPAALEYASRVVETATKDWGFPYLKLDFLYAGALAGKHHDPTLTRAQVLRKGMQALRRAAGETATLVGCGAPLGSVVGLVDAMRIGADVSGEWRPAYFGTGIPFRTEPAMPSARNSLQNIITRAPLHRCWWINDPDCLLVRENSQLTLAEVQSLATAIALTGGSLLLSDDLSALTPERLQIAVKLLPLLGKRAEVLDWFERITPQCLKLVLENDTGRWHLLARFNWEDQPANVTMTAAGYRLPDADYWVSSFWDNKICYCLKGQPLASQIVPAHGVLLLAVRPVLEGTPQILGSDLHISQGLEVKNWQVEPGAFDCTFDLGRQAAGEVELYLPYAPQSAWLDGKPLQWIESGEDRYRFAVAIHDVANLRVSWRVP